MSVLPVPLQPLWQRLSGLPLWQPGRMAIAGSIVLHSIILAFVRLPDATPPPIDRDETVALMSIPAELEADLPSIEPLLPTELPSFDSAPPPLPFTGIEPPPLSFSPLTPLPPLPPLAELPPPPPPLTFQPLPAPWHLPPPARPLPPRTTPEDEVAVAPELAPTPQAPTSEPLATTASEAAAALSRWFNQTRLTLNTTDIAVNLSQRVTDLYPREACGDRLEGQTTVAAVIRPDGQLLAANAAPETGLLSQNPQIIRTSGSDLLDQAAIATVQQQTFAATGQFKPSPSPLTFGTVQRSVEQPPLQPVPQHPLPPQQHPLPSRPPPTSHPRQLPSQNCPHPPASHPQRPVRPTLRQLSNIS